ncbi:uncharacterized protein At1g01500-like [Benincasa hispida]|uniref:uncharacterized protein At1g01500-like n=1 Tax=Benincasa hispida TaxID=102211 RepID=UPI0018FFF244|nr:uncharacterized protein At1g01500-like [Benincasa hispida]
MDNSSIIATFPTDLREEVLLTSLCSRTCIYLTSSANEQTTQVSPQRRNLRQGVLDAIPEDEEVGKEENGSNGLIRHQNVQVKQRRRFGIATSLCFFLGNSKSNTFTTRIFP